jgi:hypothetical protein
MPVKAVQVEVCWHPYTLDEEFSPSLRSTLSMQRESLRVHRSGGSRGTLLFGIHSLLCYAGIPFEKHQLTIEKLIALQKEHFEAFFDTASDSVNFFGLWLTLFLTWSESQSIEQHINLASRCAALFSHQKVCFGLSASQKWSEFLQAYNMVFFKTSSNEQGICDKCSKSDSTVTQIKCNVQTCSEFIHFGPQGCCNDQVSSEEIIFDLICDDKPFFCFKHLPHFSLEHSVLHKYFPEHSFRYRALIQSLRLISQPRWWPLCLIESVPDGERQGNLHLFGLHSLILNGLIKSREDFEHRLDRIINSGLKLHGPGDRIYKACKYLSEHFDYKTELSF